MVKRNNRSKIFANIFANPISSLQILAHTPRQVMRKGVTHNRLSKQAVALTEHLYRVQIVTRVTRPTRQLEIASSGARAPSSASVTPTGKSAWTTRWHDFFVLHTSFADLSAVFCNYGDFGTATRRHESNGLFFDIYHLRVLRVPRCKYNFTPSLNSQINCKLHLQAEPIRITINTELTFTTKFLASNNHFFVLYLHHFGCEQRRRKCQPFLNKRNTSIYQLKPTAFTTSFPALRLRGCYWFSSLLQWGTSAMTDARNQSKFGITGHHRGQHFYSCTKYIKSNPKYSNNKHSYARYHRLRPRFRG